MNYKNLLKSMETTQNQPRVYQFGPVFKTVLVLASVALIAIGITGAAESYLLMPSLAGKAGGLLLSLVPIAVALFGAPVVWRCKLSLYEDRLEYNGLLIDRVIHKEEIREALSPTPRYGMFSVFLNVYGQPFKSLHIAVLGHVDDVFMRWVGGLPHPQTSKS